MVIEKFKKNKTREIYQRYEEKGRMLPDGLKYLQSWVDINLDRCFQLMECEDPRLFQEWVDNWKDLAEFEIIPVTSSAEAKKLIMNNFFTNTK